ncbi:hypothetical protein PJL18_01672 [Paenarthrobacter nicotinovorans]|nr:hypothetical protein [Paenarthrobacter nicotinovorans]
MAIATSLVSPEVWVRDAVLAEVASVMGRIRRASSVMGNALSSAMVLPAKVTANASGLSPLPPHMGHRPVSMKRSTRSRMVLLLESARVCRT